MTSPEADAMLRSAFDPARFMAFARQVGHGAALDIDYAAHGDDWAELVLPYSPRLIGVTDTGVVASGPIVSLMDMAMSVAIWIKLGRFRPQATLDMRVDYLRPANPGCSVTGRGECYRTTRTIAFVRGTAHDGDASDPVAYVSATFIATGG